MYSPTQTDINIIRQKTKEIYLKIELLNRNYKIIDTIVGNLISDSINIQSDSKQRRSYSCNLYVKDKSFIIGADKRIWIDKYIRVYYGINDIRNEDTKWWLIGTFTYLDVNYTYSGSDSNLSLSCGDLMADYDGTKNGVISGYSITIPAGEDIRKTIIAFLKDAGITNYLVEDIGKEIPYDIVYTDSVTYCDIWSDICDLYDSWEFFFDIDGTFIWRKKPTGYSEPCVLDDVILQSLWINESINSSFKGVYNVTEVWGKVFDLSNNDRYTENSTYSNGVYSITLEGIDSLDKINHLDQIAIKICSANIGNDKVKINNLEPIPIVSDDGTLVKTDRLKADTTYVFMFRHNLGDTLQNCLYLLGQYQAYAIYKENNPEYPFSVPNLGYEIKQRLNYENLYSDDLCYNQAEYLTYQTTAMLDSITLTTILIPWLDVNQKIKYTSQVTGTIGQYIIKNISWSTLEGTMTMTLYKFLESFSYVKDKEKQRGRRI